MIVSTSYEATLPIRLVPCITTTRPDFDYMGSLAITIVGLPPTGVTPSFAGQRSYDI